MSPAEGDWDLARKIIYGWSGDMPPEKSDQVEAIVAAIAIARAWAREDALRRAEEIARGFMPKRTPGYKGLGNEDHGRDANLQAKAAHHERIQTVERIVAALAAEHGGI
jgi:uncharacterized protein (DUF2342 family)